MDDVVTLNFPVRSHGGCVCDFGEIEHTNPKPRLGEVGWLCLVGCDFANKLALALDPIPYRGGIVWLDIIDESTPEHDVPARLFMKIGYDSHLWVWELHESVWGMAHPSGKSAGDGTGMFVGRWVD